MTSCPPKKRIEPPRIDRSLYDRYAEDEELLKKEFGAAFKKLTELGCPWTDGYKALQKKIPAGHPATNGAPVALCPVMQG